jgi:capsular polysaccharide biosynthesis protein
MKESVQRRKRIQPNSEGAPLYRHQDPLAFPALGRDDFYASTSPGVFIEAPGNQRQFIRPEPEFHDDPDDVELFSDFQQDSIASYPPFIATASNVLLTGFRTVISGDGFFFNDESIAGAELKEFLTGLAKPGPLNEETGLRCASGRKGFTLDAGNRTVVRIEKPVALLTSAEPSNYGSYLFRVLPKLATLEGLAAQRDLHYLVWAEIDVFREYLRLLGIPARRILAHDTTHTIYELEKVFVPSIRNDQAFLDPESLALFAKLRAQVGVARQRGTYIYVSRTVQSRRGSERAMLNETELVERLAKLNFQIVFPEKLTAVEQIRTFSAAELVVGPAGSGMFNAVFCHPATKLIDIESEPHWIHAHRSLFASCGLRYGIFAGSATDRDYTTHHKQWKVNIPALLARIKVFLKT